MFDKIFGGIFDSDFIVSVGAGDFLLCMGVSLILGIISAFAYMYRSRYSKSFAVTLALLPAAVCVVIMLVNGNVGTGVAVAGAFSLVRFRSAPGTAREICALLIAMGTGMVAGMGYLGFAVLFAVIMCLMLLLYSRIGFGEDKKWVGKTLTVTVPEDVNYTGIFDDIFGAYTSSCKLVRVKTVNLGSMFRLTYNITLRDITKEKEMIDKIRCRNGNLEISVSEQDNGAAEL